MKLFKVLLTAITILLVSINVYAEKNNWEKNYIKALQKGKIQSQSETGGLGYSPSEDIVLEIEIQKAMGLKAPACEVMKIAVDLKYNPYLTIKNIYSSGGEVDLDQLCMCATESGVLKEIIAKAASDASSLGIPIFSRDEIIQSQCIDTVTRDRGLGYQQPFAIVPYTPAEKTRNISESSFPE